MLLLVQKNFWNLQDFDEGANKWNQLTRTAGVATMERLDAPADLFIPPLFFGGSGRLPIAPAKEVFLSEAKPQVVLLPEVSRR